WGIVGMSNCIFSDNRVVEWGGGAIYTRGGLTANNCTFVNNKGEHGGAIWDYGSRDPSFLNNCTFSANSAVSGGAAIYANHQYSTREHPKLRLSNCTFSQNFPTDGAAQMLANGTAIMSAGGSFSGGSPMTTVVVANSIFRKFGNVPSLAAINGGVIVSLGHNLSDDAADGDGGTGPGALLNGPGDRRNTDPLLGDLADNGGPTPTHALLAGSPAINAGDNTTAPPRDQRGYAREGVYDIGAFEFNSAPPQTHLANISTRAYCLSKDNVLIAGFIITGQDAKKLIVRAIGPSLAAVTRLRDPTLELFNALGQRIAFNNNWGDAPNHQEIVDTTLAPKNNLESAILLTLPPGAYTAVLRGVNDSNGLAVAEVYDLDPGANSRLANISTRSYVQGGENVMIGGFILHGPESETVVIRAIGPSLSLAKPLPDPEVTLKDANGTVLATSYDWRFDRTDDSGVGKVLATGLSPRNDFEGALVTTLPPGQYTAIVHDTEDAVGVGLVEVYALD
ncbi:MAG TPA: choice-of-anchor Q domain-containing protein, partial [Chthoniobacterales bacterium]|nr:choice-of-anchor Q domain-containing protein [Chthoniobacterales bacterium]